jgi:hypothetical protein
MSLLVRLDREIDRGIHPLGSVMWSCWLRRDSSRHSVLFQAEIHGSIQPSTSRYLPVGEIVPALWRDFQIDLRRKSIKSERRIEPAVLRFFLAQCVNQLRHRVPNCNNEITSENPANLFLSAVSTDCKQHSLASHSQHRSIEFLGSAAISQKT